MSMVICESYECVWYCDGECCAHPTIIEGECSEYEPREED